MIFGCNTIKSIVVENYGFVNTGYDAVYLATVENDTVSPESYMGHYIEYLEGLRLAAFTTNVVERNFRKKMQTLRRRK